MATVKRGLKRQKEAVKVGIVMGSDSDLDIMQETVAILKNFQIPYEITVASAHRSPKRAGNFAATALKKGMKVIIAGAGHAAHLAGVLAAHTPLPVIGVPIDSSCLQGLDALLATVQMPPGKEEIAKRKLEKIRLAATKWPRCCDLWQDGLGGMHCRDCEQKTFTML